MARMRQRWTPIAGNGARTKARTALALAAVLPLLILAPNAQALPVPHIYWANPVVASAIGQAKLDGTGVRQHFITGASLPSGVAVNGRHIYWANNGSNTIGRANLKGTGVTQDFIDATAPYGVAVNRSHIYWAHFGIPGTIGRASLNGVHIRQRFITGAGGPKGVAIDGAHIYWARGGASPGSGAIAKARLDGTRIVRHFIRTQQPDGVAVSNAAAISSHR